MKEIFQAIDSNTTIQMELDDKLLTLGDGETQRFIERSNLGVVNYEIVSGTKPILNYASLILTSGCLGTIGVLIFALMTSWVVLVVWLVLVLIASVYIVLIMLGFIRSEKPMGYKVTFSAKDSDEIFCHIALEEKEHLIQFVKDFNEKIIQAKG